MKNIKINLYKEGFYTLSNIKNCDLNWYFKS